MDNVNKTLYIPLYGKAYVSRRGLFLKDPTAEMLWASEAFALKGKSRSKWLAFAMGMRAAVFDEWVQQQMLAHPDNIVLHIGCGLDSRVRRVSNEQHHWYDIDFADVIDERQKYFAETEFYHMISTDMRTDEWKQLLPGGRAVIVMEGVSMYFLPDELKRLLADFAAHFTQVQLLMDCYTETGARLSRWRNPINDVGITRVWGCDDPLGLAENTGMVYRRSHSMAPADLVDELQGLEKLIFRWVYAGRMATALYRMYEFDKNP